MAVYSKFRSLFLIRKIFFFVILYGFILLIIFYNNTFNLDSIIISIFALIIISIFALLNLNSAYQIEISDSLMKKISFVTKEVQIITLESIINIRTYYISGMETDAGQISGSYFETILELKNNKTIIISPDYYENYGQLVSRIRQKIKE